jgi:microcystin-dependent protein
MADPFVAEIRIFPFNFAPKGWLGILRWAAPAIKSEHGSLLPVGNNLWR